MSFDTYTEEEPSAAPISDSGAVVFSRLRFVEQPPRVNALPRWMSCIRLSMEVSGPCRSGSGETRWFSEWKPGECLPYIGEQAVIDSCECHPPYGGRDEEVFESRRDEVVFHNRNLCLRVDRATVHRYVSESGHFTAGELYDVIAHHEQLARTQNRDPDGPDIHHIYFEGMYPDSEGLQGVYELQWGS